MSIDNTAFRRIITTNFNPNPITRQNTHKILPNFTTYVAKNEVFIIQSNSEHSIGERLDDRAFVAPFLLRAVAFWRLCHEREPCRTMGRVTKELGGRKSDRYDGEMRFDGRKKESGRRPGVELKERETEEISARHFCSAFWFLNFGGGRE